MGDTAGRGTPASANAAVRSLAGKSCQPKAPTRLLGKKRSATAGATPSSASKPRVTRRELKKLTEMDLEEKDEIPGSSRSSSCLPAVVLTYTMADLMAYPRLFRYGD